MVIDMKGKRIHRWTVLRRAKSDKRGYAYWLCRCDCGRVCRVNGYDLRAGKSRECIHCGRKRPKPHKLITPWGEPFAEYVKRMGVVSYFDAWRRHVWLGYSMEAAATAPPFSYKRIQCFIGARFGKLVIEKYLKKKNWLCRCDCGMTGKFNSVELISGDVTQCYVCTLIDKRKEDQNGKA